MGLIWTIIFLINIFLTSRFFYQKTLTLALQFDFQSLDFSKGEDLSFAAFILIVISNLFLFYLFRKFKKNKALKYAAFPNRTFWVSSPDLRMDALFKIRYFVCILAIWFNVTIGLAQAIVYGAYFGNKEIRSDLILLLLCSLGVIFLTLTSFVPNFFRIPKEYKAEFESDTNKNTDKNASQKSKAASVTPKK